MALNYPIILAEALPETERENAEAINRNLFFLSMIVDQLAAAVALFEFGRANRIATPADITNVSMEDIFAGSESNRMLTEWQVLAAKAGAINIYEFHRVEQAIDGMLSQSPTLDAMIDKKARKRAGRLFNSAFKNFADLRNFAAHGSEMLDNPKKLETHAARNSLPGVILLEDEASILVPNIINGDHYSSTIKGQYIGYDVSTSTVDSLKAVFNERAAMFAPAADITANIVIERTERRPQPPS